MQMCNFFYLLSIQFSVPSEEAVFLDPGRGEGANGSVGEGSPRLMVNWAREKTTIKMIIIMMMAKSCRTHCVPGSVLSLYVFTYFNPLIFLTNL